MAHRPGAGPEVIEAALERVVSAQQQAADRNVRRGADLAISA
jgi:hypothetical protein